MRAFCAAVSRVNGGRGGRDMTTSILFEPDHDNQDQQSIGLPRKIETLLPISR
jgi:hypothetical protein